MSWKYWSKKKKQTGVTLNSPEPISANSTGGNTITITWTDTNS